MFLWDSGGKRAICDCESTSGKRQSHEPQENEGASLRKVKITFTFLGLVSFFLMAKLLATR